LIEQDLTARPGTLFQLDLDLALCGLTSTPYEGWAIDKLAGSLPHIFIFNYVDHFSPNGATHKFWWVLDERLRHWYV